MTEQLTSRDRLVLTALMVEAREVSNNDLQASVGFKIEAATRERLQKLDFVIVRRPGRAYLYELSEAGWAWTREDMKAQAAPRSDAGTRVLYLLLQGLSRHLQRERQAPSWIFQPAPTAETPDVPTRIRLAYQELATVPGDWVRLTEVRQRLSDVPRSEVDAELLILLDADEINIAPEADQQRLTPEDRAAALAIGGKDKHLIMVRSS